jgi:hypothetical protein
MEKLEQPNWREHRDRKLARMLDPDEPAWLVEEVVDEERGVMYFDVVHRWQPGGWQLRRFTYDTVADVLHFRGARLLGDEALTRMKPEQRIRAHHLAA